MEIKQGEVVFNIPIANIPSVRRLVTAVGNLTEQDEDGTYCSCIKMGGSHCPSCIELSEAIKEIEI